MTLLVALLTCLSRRRRGGTDVETQADAERDQDGDGSRTQYHAEERCQAIGIRVAGANVVARFALLAPGVKVELAVALRAHEPVAAMHALAVESAPALLLPQAARRLSPRRMLDVAARPEGEARAPTALVALADHVDLVAVLVGARPLVCESARPAVHAIGAIHPHDAVGARDGAGVRVLALGALLARPVVRIIGLEILASLAIAAPLPRNQRVRPTWAAVAHASGEQPGHVAQALMLAQRRCPGRAILAAIVLRVPELVCVTHLAPRRLDHRPVAPRNWLVEVEPRFERPRAHCNSDHHTRSVEGTRHEYIRTHATRVGRARLDDLARHPVCQGLFVYEEAIAMLVELHMPARSIKVGRLEGGEQVCARGERHRPKCVRVGRRRGHLVLGGNRAGQRHVQSYICHCRQQLLQPALPPEGRVPHR